MKMVYVKKTDAAYPDVLKQYPKMPDGLYVLGDLPDPDKKTVAIVGSRACSLYGKEQALLFGEELAKRGVQIVSGMAYGVDAWAHQGALNGGGKTFAVLGCGVDVCYPKENFALYEKIQKNGGIISEFELGDKPAPWHFPIRNRIISALSDAVIVVEAKLKSGSLITVDYALEQGKTVYAVPGRVNDSLSGGTNALILQGAEIACTPEQVIKDLGINEGEGLSSYNKDDRSEKLAELSDEERCIYQIMTREPATAESILKKTNMEWSKVTSILINLQMKHLIKEPIHGHFCL